MDATFGSSPAEPDGDLTAVVAASADAEYSPAPLSTDDGEAFSSPSATPLSPSGRAGSASQSGRRSRIPIRKPKLKGTTRAVKQACNNCRRAKAACSEERPCARCVQHSLADTCCDEPKRAVVRASQRPATTAATAALSTTTSPPPPSSSSPQPAPPSKRTSIASWLPSASHTDARVCAPLVPLVLAAKSSKRSRRMAAAIAEAESSSSSLAAIRHDAAAMSHQHQHHHHHQHQHYYQPHASPRLQPQSLPPQQSMTTAPTTLLRGGGGGGGGTDWHLQHHQGLLDASAATADDTTGHVNNDAATDDPHADGNDGGGDDDDNDNDRELARSTLGVSEWAFDDAGVGFGVGNLVLVRCNEAFQQLLGMPIAAEPRRTLLDMSLPVHADRVRSLQALVAGGTVQKIELFQLWSTASHTASAAATHRRRLKSSRDGGTKPEGDRVNGSDDMRGESVPTWSTIVVQFDPSTQRAVGLTIVSAPIRADELVGYSEWLQPERVFLTQPTPSVPYPPPSLGTATLPAAGDVAASSTTAPATMGAGMMQQQQQQPSNSRNTSGLPYNSNNSNTAHSMSSTTSTMAPAYAQPQFFGGGGEITSVHPFLGTVVRASSSSSGVAANGSLGYPLGGNVGVTTVIPNIPAHFVAGGGGGGGGGAGGAGMAIMLGGTPNAAAVATLTTPYGGGGGGGMMAMPAPPGTSLPPPPPPSPFTQHHHHTVGAMYSQPQLVAMHPQTSTPPAIYPMMHAQSLPPPHYSLPGGHQQPPPPSQPPPSTMAPPPPLYANPPSIGIGSGMMSTAPMQPMVLQPPPPPSSSQL